jgi:hypothetical protein
MPRTDQEIYEYMAYYNTTQERQWALENLCRVEHKTPEEIKEICKREGEKVKKYSDSVKNAVICDRLKGVPASRIACEQGLTTKQVENIFTMYKQKLKASEAAEHVETEAVSETKQAEAAPAVPAKAPEAYPGQINDDVESDVKVFLPGDVVIKPINVFAALLAMQQFINAIAEGAEITEAAASAGNDAHVSFSFGGADYGLELRRIG